MKILVTNDDGVQAAGLWTLVRELQDISQVTVVAPEREQSAIGTAVTLFADLKVNRVSPPVPGIETYAVSGTPGDCVILALSRLLENIDLVISGINHGSNVGDDVLISGTVAGALQGYLHGCHALAVSQPSRDGHYLEDSARLTARLVRWLDSRRLSGKLFINANLPDRPLAEVAGVRITRMASITHINSVEVGDGGEPHAYRLVRQQRDNHAAPQTDVWAVAHGHVSLTPLHTELFHRPTPEMPEDLGTVLLESPGTGRHPSG